MSIQNNAAEYLRMQEKERQEARKPMWFDWQSYRERFQTAEGLINSFTGKRDELKRSLEQFKPEHVEERVTELWQSTQQQVAEQFAEIRKHAEGLLSKAEQKAEVKIPWDERTYWATATAQDIAHGDPDRIMRLYERVIADGLQARRLELERLADPVMRAAGGEKAIQWMQLKAQGRTPEEATAFKLKAAMPTFNADVSAFEHHANWLLGEAKNSAHAGSVALTTGFQRFQDNVERAAENPYQVDVAA